ncbi:DUF7269 family protein [Halobacterium litoreum]|uniref:Uncharacterized protein n=1 Tax=Halobacterium litoreum TaxID=2039234 RepID=A0ABD5NCC8_9EURY|nr:hypothetical protein [Halobacterium litoreum]UHH14359.1 hypothetical protein LT972_05005 [Halobacterium litoreum]
MTRFRTAFAAVGVAAVAVAAGVGVGALPPSVTGPVTGLDATLATGVLGAGLVGYALRQRRNRDGPDEDRRLSEPPEAADARDPGAAVDDAIERATDGRRAVRTRDAKASVRQRVRRTAIRAYACTRNVDDGEAADAVGSGAWTRDPIAAAFVGDERAPRLPLRERLRGWLHPDRAFERRAERATNAVHALATEGSQ